MHTVYILLFHPNKSTSFNVVFFSSGCNFWSRRAMGTVDTALESWDIEFFKNKILGTIGVPRLSLKFHLWVKLVHFPSIFILVQTCYFWVPWIPQWYPNFLRWKVWYLGFQMPCRTSFYDFRYLYKVVNFVFFSS